MRRASYPRVMVNLTRIYTRTGDGGQTRLGDMSTTTKTDLRLAAYADVDEANAQLGLAIAQGELEADVVAVLTHVQNDLFDVGADFCTPVRRRPGVPAAADRAGVRRPARGVVRPVQRVAAEPALVHPERRHPRRRAAARRPHRHPARRAVGLGGPRGARRDDEPARDHLPEPALRPAVHPGPARQPRAGRRAVGAGRRAVALRRRSLSACTWRAGVNGSHLVGGDPSPAARRGTGRSGRRRTRAARRPVARSASRPTAAPRR